MQISNFEKFLQLIRYLISGCEYFLNFLMFEMNWFRGGQAHQGSHLVAIFVVYLLVQFLLLQFVIQFTAVDSPIYW